MKAAISFRHLIADPCRRAKLNRQRQAGLGCGNHSSLAVVRSSYTIEAISAMPSTQMAGATL
jgi:hypothetical protein